MWQEEKRGEMAKLLVLPLPLAAMIRGVKVRKWDDEKIISMMMKISFSPITANSFIVFRIRL